MFCFLVVRIFERRGTMMGVGEEGGVMKKNEVGNGRRGVLGDWRGRRVGRMLGRRGRRGLVEC